jgi:hypothetical protein
MCLPGAHDPKGTVMFTTSTAAAPSVAVTPIPLRDIAPWAIFGLLIAVLAIYFVGAEQGAVALFGGEAIHEFVHDGRHLLGFPCH